MDFWGLGQESASEKSAQFLQYSEAKLIEVAKLNTIGIHCDWKIISTFLRWNFNKSRKNLALTASQKS